jgi:branched-chain amino acid transport system substrate-binding protein
MRITGRDLMQATAATALAGFVGDAAAAESAGAARVELLTVKTGPLASGGIDMERVLVMYLDERNNELFGSTRTPECAVRSDRLGIRHDAPRAF